jgi:hypothetical protein
MQNNTSLHTNGGRDAQSNNYLSPNPGERLATPPLYQGEADTDQTVVVCGAGGIIGGHLVADLLRQGYNTVRAVDITPTSTDTSIRRAPACTTQRSRTRAKWSPLRRRTPTRMALPGNGYRGEKLFSE